MQTLILVASATLGIVCLSRWLVYNGTVGAGRFDDRCGVAPLCLGSQLPFLLGADASRSSDAAQRGRWPPEVDERSRHERGLPLTYQVRGLTVAVDRRGGRGYTSQQPTAERKRSAAETRYQQGDVVDVWYE